MLFRMHTTDGLFPKSLKSHEHSHAYLLQVFKITSPNLWWWYVTNNRTHCLVRNYTKLRKMTDFQGHKHQLSRPSRHQIVRRCIAKVFIKVIFQTSLQLMPWVGYRHTHIHILYLELRSTPNIWIPALFPCK